MEPIRSIYENDPDMMGIVREFAAELPGRAAELERALGGADFATLKTLAHQLKGAGGGYGFDRITEVAGKLEHALKEGAAEPLVRELCATVCETLRAVVVGEVG